MNKPSEADRPPDELAGSLLIVDDDHDIVANLCDILMDLGYHADAATSPGQAIQLVDKNDYDVALLDYNMPEQDGAALYKQMRARQPATTAIMITAYADADAMDRAAIAGVWRVISKPVNLKDLIPLIEQATQRSKLCRSKG
jgi:DNA-binding NtrC family response regulator